MDSNDSTVTFSSLQLPAPILSAVEGLGYEQATPVQAECIPPMLQGRDLLGQAQTGTGKTAAFALPLLANIDLKQSLPQVLVLTPTRELALQVAEALQAYARNLRGFHVLPVYGGQGMSMQLRQLKRGAHVVVGTPGRVMDHLRRGSLSLQGLSTLVLDEADEMLNMGFVEDIEWIFEQAPEQRQVALFSATMPAAIRKVADKYLSDPVTVKVAAKTTTGSNIVQQHCVVTHAHKLDAFTRILEVEEFDAMLVFVRTRLMTVDLTEKLQAHGFATEALNGDMNQDQRERTVNGLKRGRIDIVVATDVAARGLDVDRISHVVNYDIPNNPEAYVHRIGRTGRAGREGHALLFVQPRERHLLRAIERSTRQPIPPLEMPSAGQLSEHRVDRFVQSLRKTFNDQDLDFHFRLVARIEKEQEMSALDIAAALTYMVQGDRPFEVRELPRGGPQRREQRFERDRGRDQGRDRGRGDHPRREREPRPPRAARGGEEDLKMLRYRLAVGYEHGVNPGEIVGAIANELGLDGKYIGHIDIRDHYSVVALPDGMPSEAFKHLRGIHVRGQALKARLWEEEGDGRRGPPRRDADDGRSGFRGKPGKKHAKSGHGDKKKKKHPSP